MVVPHMHAISTFGIEWSLVAFRFIAALRQPSLLVLLLMLVLDMSLKSHFVIEARVTSSASPGLAKCSGRFQRGISTVELMVAHIRRCRMMVLTTKCGVLAGLLEKGWLGLAISFECFYLAATMFVVRIRP